MATMPKSCFRRARMCNRVLIVVNMLIVLIVGKPLSRGLTISTINTINTINTWLQRQAPVGWCAKP